MAVTRAVSYKVLYQSTESTFKNSVQFSTACVKFCVYTALCTVGEQGRSFAKAAIVGYSLAGYGKCCSSNPVPGK